MLNLKAMVLPVALVAGLFGTTNTAKAQTAWEQVDALALHLADSVEILHDVSHAHFQHTPVFQAFDLNVEQMEELSAHIHDVAHDGGGLRHLATDLRALDTLHHETESLLAHMGRWGQVNVIAYQQLQTSLNDVHGTLRQLRRLVRALEHQQLFQPPICPSYPQGQPGYPQIQPFPQVQPANGIQFRFNFGR